MSLLIGSRQKNNQNLESHGTECGSEVIGRDVGQLGLKKGSSIRASSGKCSGGGSTPVPPAAGGGGGHHIRRYLVLLHDSLAIKFTPCASPPQPSLFKCSNNRKNNGVNTPTDRNRNRTHKCNSEDPLGFGYGSKLDTKANTLEPLGRKSFSRPSSAASVTFPTRTLPGIVPFPPGPPVLATEVDHSLHGLYLYKGFRDANLQCFWNTPLYDAVRNLEYKGYVVPFTVLISALPQFLNTIRTAWSRQMLRSPPGYRIDFIGEIEELLADPIQQSQFAPLSDSLCWAILEVTSSGQEAFVDSILTALTTAFPTMIIPNRELVYQTLEKLIKDRKVYQTASGYFVVTPDTFRYMISSSPLPQPRSSSHPPSHQLLPAISTATLTLDSVNTPPDQPLHHDPDKVSRNSWDSTASAENPVPDERGRSKKGESRDLPLRRHNSLRIIRQRDKEAGNSQSFLRGRSLSFRLYKSKSTPIGSEETGETPSHRKGSTESSTKPDKVEKKAKLGGKSFFKKLFKRSSSKKSTSESPSPKDEPIQTKFTSTTIATQTSSTEALELHCSGCEPNLDTIQIRGPQVLSKTEQGQREAKKLPERPKNLNIEYHSDQLLSVPWNSLPQEGRDLRPSSRLSSTTPTLIDDGHFYAYPAQKENIMGANGDNNQIEGVFPFQRGETSRCSTLSRGTSLGYGSQGPSSSLVGFYSQSQSPTPSMSPSNYAGYSRRSIRGPPLAHSHLISRNSSNYGSYKNSYDYYRRRYPTYGNYQQESKNCPTATVREKPNIPMTGRPTSQQSHYYETIGFPNRTQPGKSTMTETISGTNPRKSEATIRNTFPSPRINNRKANEPFVSTTTVTQKSTTNMEVELRLPLGKFSNRKSNGRTSGGSSSILINGNDTKFNVNVGNGSGEECSGGTEIHIGQPRRETEVKTTVSHSNGKLQTQFGPENFSKTEWSNKEMSPNGRIPNTSDLNHHESNPSSGSYLGLKPEERITTGPNTFRRNSYDYAVKVTDLDKDSDPEFI